MEDEVLSEEGSGVRHESEQKHTVVVSGRMQEGFQRSRWSHDDLGCGRKQQEYHGEIRYQATVWSAKAKMGQSGLQQ